MDMDRLNDLYSKVQANEITLNDFLNAVEKEKDISYQDGYDNGYSEGYNEGEREGYRAGYSEGVDVGFDDGYDNGFIDGESSKD